MYQLLFPLISSSSAKIFRALVRNRRHEADETMVSIRARNDRASLKRTSGMEPIDGAKTVAGAARCLLLITF